MSVRSATGPQLERAQILSVDSAGKRVQALPTGYEGIRCRETRQHALSSPDDDREDRLVAEGRRSRLLSTLSDFDREVAHMLGKLELRAPVQERIPSGDLVAWERKGYGLVPNSAEMHMRPGSAPMETVLVEGFDVIEVKKLDYEEAAKHFGVTKRQIQRSVKRIGSAMRSVPR